ncbi:MAG: hypothetical protein J6K31_07305 [Parabacteroides sp.]|nr:hypothetical protein [Parabacteroides sp.]
MEKLNSRRIACSRTNMNAVPNILKKICRFFTLKSDFTALTTVFPAMKTVVKVHEVGPHGAEDRLQGKKLRTSWRKGMFFQDLTGVLCDL